MTKQRMEECLLKELGQCDCDVVCDPDVMTDEEIDAELYDKAWAKD